MSSEEPLPRSHHAAVGIGQTLYIWGGKGFVGIQSGTVHGLDTFTLAWEKLRQFNGSLPEGLHGMAVAMDGENGYTFGGQHMTSSYWTYCTRVYQLNPAQSTLRELLPAKSGSQDVPGAKRDSGMVYFKQKLVVCGGYGDKRWTDELHVFDLTERVWAVQPTTGKKPPPLARHSFTKIDHHRAVVFGGSTGGSPVNDTYVLDMETWHWTKLVCGVQPPPRYEHAACCIAGPLTGQDHPLLMMVGGHNCYSGREHSDVWLLDVDKGVWSKVTLPVPITPTESHSAVVFGSGPSFRVVIVFGGCTTVSFRRVTTSETTLLLLELRGGSWQVTRVVKPDELGRPDESLREQMRKLELSPQEGDASDVKQSLREEQDKWAEIEEEVHQLTKQLFELQTQSTDTDEVAPPTSPEDTFKLSPTHTGCEKAEAKIDSAAITADFKHEVFQIDFSHLDIGDKRLGKGGYGDVYEGKWKKQGGKRVAVKVIRSSATRAILREIEVWSSLPSHPNIIAFFGVTFAKFNTFITSELATNGSLFDYLHIEKNTPSVDQSLAWALDVAHGMKYLHNYDIIHRDLKSANVLLTDVWVAKLCDFGCARELTHTITTEQAGTYRWMSPEIMKKAVARINKKCDLFSYGMILFELFAHEVPYSDLENEVDVLKSITDGIRPPIPPTLPPYLHDLLKKCWQEDPHLRPTFDDFVSNTGLA